MLKWPLFTGAFLSFEQAASWNSFNTYKKIYSFQEYYADAQYGPDFGYYSTGRILHADGPADNGAPDEGGGSQEWFNSYTTLPMSLSPFYAQTLCDRIVSMWHEMGRPSPIYLIEFGGGTGMLARDILRRSRDAHADFYGAVFRYVIGERSEAMRTTQRRTAAEFLAAGKLLVVGADGRRASLLRPVLDEVAGSPGQRVRGFVLSNELVDEFDPVRLRLVWRKGCPPSRSDCSACASYREAHVLHAVDFTALDALLARTPGGKLGDGAAAATGEELDWEGRVLPCGLLATRLLSQAMAAVAEDLPLHERLACAPWLVCCLPFLLAVDQALRYHHEALDPEQVLRRHGQEGSRELVRLYRFHLEQANGTVLLSKERYRELRRLAAANGVDVERALLVGAPAVLPGRLRSHEVFLALGPTRCRELRGWMRRQAARFAAAARLRESSAPLYDGDPSSLRTAMHLKVVLRPGEAAFVEEAARLLDEGFLVTLDYGADADALAWQALIRPNYEGIQIVDAREELVDECTLVSYLECPGLQDLTTSVDFTEIAVAGRQLGDWDVRAYGPIFLVELSFDAVTTSPEPAALLAEPHRLGHLIERAGGLGTAGLQAWYRTLEQDPWASFKVLVQHRGVYGANWTLGPVSVAWPLEATPRLFQPPSLCWSQDLTKPPLASLIALAARRALEGGAEDADWGAHDGNAPSHLQARVPAPAQAMHAASARVYNTSSILSVDSDDARVQDAVMQQFTAVLLQGDEPLSSVIEAQHVAQQQAYADVHLALILVDYWRLLGAGTGGESGSEGQGGPGGPRGPDAMEFWRRLHEVRAVAVSRRLPELYGGPAFERVLGDLGTAAAGWAPAGGAQPPHLCLAARALHAGAMRVTAIPVGSGMRSARVRK